MAAYAALVSVTHIIHQIQLHHRPPISVDKPQLQFLTENVTFLQQFLEGYSSREADDALETRIADAAYAAEDVIESYIVDRILAGNGGKINSSVDLYQDLRKVIEDMDSLRKEVMEMRETMGAPHQPVTASLGFASTGQNTAMVGFDDVFVGVMDKLTNGQLDRRIIPIVGMGGIGKTTLARKIYENRLVVQHFDVLAWATVSQEYKMGEILLQLLQEGGGDSSRFNENELGEKLHKRLSGRRYLIIMDDIWDVEVW